MHSSTIRSLAEVTLALVLFADASRVNVRSLRTDAALPARLLGIGLPLTIGAGAGAAALLFGGSGLWVAAAIGAIVAPTDAALGASIMGDNRVPSGVRRLLNVESGLNDGIATPFVNLFIAGAVSAEAVSGAHPTTAALDLLGGAGLGIAVGVAGATLLALAGRHGWSAAGFRPIAVLGLALFAYSVSVAAGTNGFIAAFVAGMAFGTVDRAGARSTCASPKRVARSSPCSSGSRSAPPCWRRAWRTWAGARWCSRVLALTVLRMVPVALALAGSGLDRATVFFVGWFGPRGLASVVFGLIAVDSLAPAQIQGGAGGSDADRGPERPAPRDQCVTLGRPLWRAGAAPPPGATRAHRRRRRSAPGRSAALDRRRPRRAQPRRASAGPRQAPDASAEVGEAGTPPPEDPTWTGGPCRCFTVVIVPGGPSGCGKQPRGRGPWPARDCTSRKSCSTKPPSIITGR